MLLATILFQGNESIVAKTTLTVPNDGGPIEAIATIETIPYYVGNQRKAGKCVCMKFRLL